MTKKERVLNVIEILKKEYPNAICSLNSSNAFELLVAVRLSAQCTDARVNLVTPALFERYKTLDDYANADVKDKYGVNVHTSYIAQVKRMCGLDMGENYNKSKKENPEVWRK